MNFVFNGDSYSLTAEQVRTALRGGAPEHLRDHWVEVDGVKWPPKQALSLVTPMARGDFTSHMALRQFRRLGFPTSSWPHGARTPGGTSSSARGSDAAEQPPTDWAVTTAAFETLIAFLSSGLTQRIRDTEAALIGVDRELAEDLVGQSQMTGELLAAALLVRKHAGRLSDVIHAATIVQLLPTLLEPGEQVRVRPSLAAGNDPSRPYDLETDRRIAEFKLSFWKGADAMRMRGVFADLVHLAMDDSGRRAQLFVVGERPIRFLQSGGATTTWALGRASPNLRERFAARYGTTDMSIKEFTAGPASHVELVNLTERLPLLAD